MQQQQRQPRQRQQLLLLEVLHVLLSVLKRKPNQTVTPTASVTTLSYEHTQTLMHTCTTLVQSFFLLLLLSLLAGAGSVFFYQTN